MESNQKVFAVTFTALQERLLTFVRLRIQNGEYTERGLARVMGISQPQIHNVLKGARALRPVLADRFLRKFGITALELVTDAELNAAVALRFSLAALQARVRSGEGAPEPDPDAKQPHRWRKPATRSARLGLARRDEAS